MLKKLLAEKGIILTKELSDFVIADIKLNRIKFKKCTSLHYLLNTAIRNSNILKKS